MNPPNNIKFQLGNDEEKAPMELKLPYLGGYSPHQPPIFDLPSTDNDEPMHMPTESKHSNIKPRPIQKLDVTLATDKKYYDHEEVGGKKWLERVCVAASEGGDYILTRMMIILHFVALIGEILGVNVCPLHFRMYFKKGVNEISISTAGWNTLTAGAIEEGFIDATLFIAPKVNVSLACEECRIEDVISPLIEKKLRKVLQGKYGLNQNNKKEKSKKQKEKDLFQCKQKAIEWGFPPSLGHFAFNNHNKTPFLSSDDDSAIAFDGKNYSKKVSSKQKHKMEKLLKKSKKKKKQNYKAKEIEKYKQEIQKLKAGNGRLRSRLREFIIKKSQNSNSNSNSKEERSASRSRSRDRSEEIEDEETTAEDFDLNDW